MTFDEAITKADEALDAAVENDTDPNRAGVHLTTADTWVRIAELLHHREADSK